jgi:hypothetical protein
MPDENVELFRRAVEALNDDDLNTALEISHEEGSFEPLRAATEGAFHGHDGLRMFYEDTRASFDVFQAHYDEVRALPDGRVLAIGTIRVRGRGSGAETEVPSACLFSFRDGLMWHFKDYGDKAQALEAAGLA